MSTTKIAGLTAGFLIFVIVNYTLFNSWPSANNNHDNGQGLKPEHKQTNSGSVGYHNSGKTFSQHAKETASELLVYDDNQPEYLQMGELEKKLKLYKGLLNDGAEYTVDEENPLQAIRVTHIGDYMKFISDADNADLQDPLIHKHEYRFPLNNEYACHGDVFLLVVVHSAAGKQAERNAIRRTWGQVRFHSGAVIVPVFMLAKPGRAANISQAQLVKESKMYRDIIQGDFLDTYVNLTYKHVMLLHWIQHHCNNAKFILKVDDDVMVDIYHVVNFLFQKSPDGVTQNFMYCSIYRNQGPRRSTNDKWYVSKEVYPYSRYPPYCEGFAYIMSYDVSRALYQSSPRVPFYWVDDVYVTGFLAAHAGVALRAMENGHGYTLMRSNTLHKDVQSCMFLLAKYESYRKHWDQAWDDIRTVNGISS